MIGPFELQDMPNITTMYPVFYGKGIVVGKTSKTIWYMCIHKEDNYIVVTLTEHHVKQFGFCTFIHQQAKFRSSMVFNSTLSIRQDSC